MALLASVQATPGANGGTTGAIDTTGAKLIVIHIASFAAVSGVSDSKGNTWIPKTVRSNVAATRYSQQFYALSPTVGSGHTFTVSGTGTYAVIEVVAYDNVVAFDAESGAGSNGAVATIQPGSVPPAGNNGLFITGVCSNLGSIPSIDSGFTLRLSTANGIGNNMEAGVADKQQTTGGAENPTWQLWDINNVGATDECACSMLVLKPAAPPPPTGWGPRLAGERNRRVRGL
jgi:hypothetical protein